MPRPFNSETARKAQELAAKKRVENSKKRFFLIRSGQDILVQKKKVSEEDREKAKYVGVKLGKNATVAETVFVSMLADAKKRGDNKAFVELLKVAGMHFDQSPEALGGTENPINVAQKMAIAPEQVKEISEELEGNC